MKSEYITMAIAAIGLIVNITALVALWSNLASIWFNYKHFRKGGVRITYPSGAYEIKEGDLDGDRIYISSTKGEIHRRVTDMGESLDIEDIPKFFKWNASRWTDDIRTPQYPLSLL